MGLPQYRHRLWIVAIRKDALKTDFLWSAPIDPMPLADFLVPCPGGPYGSLRTDRKGAQSRRSCPRRLRSSQANRDPSGLDCGVTPCSPLPTASQAAHPLPCALPCQARRPLYRQPRPPAHVEGSRPPSRFCGPRFCLAPQRCGQVCAAGQYHGHLSGATGPRGHFCCATHCGPRSVDFRRGPKASEGRRPKGPIHPKSGGHPTWTA